MATPADPTDLSMNPSSPPGADESMPPARAGDQSSDEQCNNGMHYVYQPKSDSFENVGSCDQVHGADQPSAAANDAYKGQFAPASDGLPPDPQEVARTQALIRGLRNKVQGTPNGLPQGGATAKSLGGLGKGSGMSND